MTSAWRQAKSRRVWSISNRCINPVVQVTDFTLKCSKFFYCNLPSEKESPSDFSLFFIISRMAASLWLLGLQVLACNTRHKKNGKLKLKRWYLRGEYISKIMLKNWVIVKKYLYVKCILKFIVFFYICFFIRGIVPRG